VLRYSAVCVSNSRALWNVKGVCRGNKEGHVVCNVLDTATNTVSSAMSLLKIISVIAVVMAVVTTTRRITSRATSHLLCPSTCCNYSVLSCCSIVSIPAFYLHRFLPLLIVFIYTCSLMVYSPLSPIPLLLFQNL
jgi:hypothetical protein